MYHYVRTVGVRIGHFCRSYIYLCAVFAYVRVHIFVHVRVYVGAGPSGGGGGGGGARCAPPLDPLLHVQYQSEKSFPMFRVV